MANGDDGDPSLPFWMRFLTWMVLSLVPAVVHVMNANPAKAPPFTGRWLAWFVTVFASAELYFLFHKYWSQPSFNLSGTFVWIMSAVPSLVAAIGLAYVVIWLF